MMSQDILLVSNEHTTPYPKVRKKIWDILLSSELASQLLHLIIPQNRPQISSTGLTPPKARHPQQFPTLLHPYGRHFLNKYPKEKWGQWRQITRGRSTARIVGVPHHSQHQSWNCILWNVTGPSLWMLSDSLHINIIFLLLKVASTLGIQCRNSVFQSSLNYIFFY